MKLTNIYKDLISCRLKDNRVIIGDMKDDDNRQLYGVSDNTFMLYYIPKNEFLLDVDKALSHWSKLNMGDFSPKNVEEVTRTNKLFNITDVYNKKGYTVELIGNEYINTKYLKNFDNPTFKTDMSKRFTPVYVYEKGLLVGMVLPINPKGHPELEQ